MIRFALSLVALASPALAQDALAVAPVYAQLVAVPLPAGFEAGYEAEQVGSYILEFVPRGESVEAWSQLITLTGAQGLAASLTVGQAAETIGAGYRAACPATFASQPLPAPAIPGATATAAAFLGCGEVEGRSEAMVLVVMQGREDVYTLQWATRGPAAASPPAYDPAAWAPRLASLAQGRVCDEVAGEAAPYPSCTG